jgi:hypothetical protein
MGGDSEIALCCIKFSNWTQSVLAPAASANAAAATEAQEYEALM